MQLPQAQAQDKKKNIFYIFVLVINMNIVCTNIKTNVN